MHVCPNCGQACYCGGDIDDCQTAVKPESCAHECIEVGDEFDEWNYDETLDGGEASS
jgi:hypothetical protein